VRRREKSFFGLAKRSFPFWFGGIWFVVGAPFLVLGLYFSVDAFLQREEFKREGQVTQGIVLTKQISRSQRDTRKSTNYWVGYRFTAADGRVVRSEAQVSRDLWDRLVEREPVQVTYLPSRPRTNWIEGQGPNWMLPLVFALLGVVLASIGGWILLKGVSGIARELRLQSEGTIAEATVVEVGPASVTFNGVPQWRIRYHYQDHRGRTHSGASGLMAPDEAQEWKVGDKGTARYDTRAPRKSVWVGRP